MKTKATATLLGGEKVKGWLTTDHAASSYGQPVFVDNAGQAYDWFGIADISTAAAMGSKTSAKKTAAVRQNAKLGGRRRTKPADE